MRRASLSSTMSASSLISTRTASGTSISTLEVRMPCLQNIELVRRNNALNGSQLAPAEAATPLQPHWIQPELRHFLFPLYVNMHRLLLISGIKEKPIGSRPQDRW